MNNPSQARTKQRGASGTTARPRIDFQSINSAALDALPALLARWLPEGKQSGHEWVSLNPKRADSHAGSFSVNINTGKWADFATGDRGGDPVSLAAYLFDMKQGEAAREIAAMLGGIL